FLTSSAQQFYEFDLNSDCCFEDNTNYMILIRHENLWNTKYLHDSEDSYTQLYLRLKGEGKKLHFPPVFSSGKSINDSNLTLNLTAEPRNDPETSKCIIPRQKFILFYVEDRYLTLYLYNWSNEMSSGIEA